MAVQCESPYGRFHMTLTLRYLTDSWNKDILKFDYDAVTTIYER